MSSKTKQLYGERRNGASHGDVFTSPVVVSFMLDLLEYLPEKDLSAISVLEPSCGEGIFLLEIQRRLVKSSKIYGFDPVEVFTKNIFACEIDRDKLDRCIKQLQSCMPSFKPQNLNNEDFLFSSWNVKFDIVIGNPPYVRYENIDPLKRDLYKKEFTTFHYRADLYVLFFEHSLRFLSENGKHCFICSDRWLKNEYGKKLRALISDRFNMEYLIDAERIKAFKDAVLAYPAITIITNTRNKYRIKTATISELEELLNPIEYVEKRYSEHDNWCEIFLNSNTEGLLGIEEQGFSIGIGV
ncbi:MAG: Eco57I restriction-modification methylase domain-containing protein, partial [Muribaculaceae bacterium]|nr:Eco57I restriction-modification methylase domain-containing protein [Muribaculaceae bacterium]